MPQDECNAFELPSALENLSRIRALAPIERMAVFLDYDGTLTPIVSRPEAALFSREMRTAVTGLAARCPVAIVSGRGLDDVRALVGIPNISYAGSHGFEIADPQGRRFDCPEAAFAALLDEVERELRRMTAVISGAEVERKKFSIAAHYRNVRREDVPFVLWAVDELIARRAGLRVSPGKKVRDIQPDVDCNKGTAVRRLLAEFGSEFTRPVPLYIGDDLTDEEAFRVVRERGVGIIVRDEPRRTRAQYALNNTDEVRRFLVALGLPSS